MSPVGGARLVAVTLGRAYLFFFLVSYSYWLLLRALGLSVNRMADIAWYEPLAGAVYANGEMLFVNVVLWLVVCLALTTLLFLMLRRALPVVAVLACALAVLVAGLSANRQILLAWPWCAGNAMLLLFFFCLGAESRHSLQEASDFVLRVSGLAVLVGSLGALIIVAALSQLNGRVDFLSLIIGNSWPLFLLNALLGVGAIVVLCRMLPRSRITEWCSINLLVILLAHPLFFSVITGCAKIVFGRKDGFNENLAGAAIYFSGALLMSWLTVKLMVLLRIPLSDRSRWSGLTR